MQVLFHDAGAMSLRSIPDQDERFSDVTAQMVQSQHDLFGVDRAGEVAFVDLAREGQSGQGGHFPAIPAQASEQRRLATRCPGETGRLREGQAKLVFKDDLGAEPLRLFLSWASRGSTRPGRALRHAPWPGFPASARSSPAHATAG